MRTLICVLLAQYITLLCSAPASAGGGHDHSDVSLPDASVQLVQIGVRSYPDGLRVPMWAVMIGNTARAELRAREHKEFGPYSLNGTVWVPSGNAQTWVRVTYRRPQTLDDVVDWYSNAEAFSSRKEGGISLLPRPFSELSSDVIQRIDFIVVYEDRSAKAYLLPGISKQEGEAITDLLENLLGQHFDWTQPKSTW